MATSKEKVEDIITCAICYEKFEGRDPRSLPCLHSFCLACIKDVHQTATNKQDSNIRDDEFRCPQCTSVCTIPRSVDNFPKFFHATNMLEILNDLSLKKDNFHRVSWNVCPNDGIDIAGYCFTCTKLFCEECLKCHTNNRRYASHVHVRVTKDKIKSLICPDHNRLIEAYCVGCCRAVCDQCELESHQNHDVEDFVVNEDLTEDTFQLSVLLQSQKQGNKKSLEAIDNLQKDFNVHMDSIKDQIFGQVEKLIKEINDQSVTLYAEIDSHREHVNLKLNKRRFIIQDSDDTIEDIELQNARFTQPLPELTSVGLRNLNKILQDIMYEIPLEAPNFCGISFVKFKSNHNEKTIGTLSKTSYGSSRDESGNDGSASYGSFLTSRSGFEQSPIAHYITSIDTGHDIQDVAWSQADDLYAATEKAHVVTFNALERKVKWTLFPVSDGGKSISVAVGGPQSSVAIAVTHEYWGNDSFHIMPSISQKKLQPRHVCDFPIWSGRVTFAADGAILLSGGHTRKLTKVKTDGQKMWERKTEHEYWFITATPKNNIIVCGQEKMFVHDSLGNMISPFPEDVEMLKSPSGVCTDSKGNVYVVDQQEFAVLVFTEEGRFVKEVACFNNQPQNIAFHPDDTHFCVTVLGRDNKKSCLKIYTL